ncbi:MAG: thioredoxin family protein [Rhodobacteraceae bacterium]|nr:thioredoxin family protein [Paracoccaceae bacterium]
MNISINRRHFLITTAASVALPVAAFAAEDWIDFEPGVIQALLNEGKTVMVDYSAVWCSTCKAQKRVMTDLRTLNPAYNEAMVFVRVDWDDYGRHAVTTSRKIPRRSTLIILRGNEELGRIVAGTRVSDIEALMDLVL